jgi:O-acetyl-ADP-ribose deacetylase (regulator of RNase III)
VYYNHDVSPAPLLASAHAYALALAREYGAQSVAFPAISCGTFGYPHHLAADVATQVIAKHSRGLREVALVIGDSAHLKTWREAAQRVAVQDDRRSKQPQWGRKLRRNLIF